MSKNQCLYGKVCYCIRRKTLWHAFVVQDGRTPLLLAAERGHTDLVRKLAGQYEGDIFHKMKVCIWIQSHPHTHPHPHTHTHTHTPPHTHTHTHTQTHTYSQTPTSLLQNSRNALHLAAYRGHLPVLQYLSPMFGGRVLDKDGNGKTCLDIAHRLGRESIAEFLTQNYPRLQGKVG